MSIDAGSIELSLQAQDQPIELIVVAQLKTAQPALGRELGI